MRRGKPFEMALAVLGTVIWFVLGVTAILKRDLFGSVLEIIRWQQGQPALAISNRPRASRGDPAVLTTAWFGLGGLSAVFVLGIVWAIRDPHGATAPSSEGTAWLLSGAAYLIFGALAAWFPSHNYDRRELAKSGTPEVPPPPSPSRESVDPHNADPLHEAGGPTATLHHLRLEQGVELDAFSPNDVVLRTHEGLRVDAPSM